MKFFKIVLATFFGLCLFGLLILLLVIGIAATANQETTIKENSILHLKLDAPIVDKAVNNPFANFNPMSFSSESTIGLNTTLKSIEKASKDPKIKGIFLDCMQVEAGFATVEEIRNALIQFKKSGKFIVSYSEFYTHKAYYLSTVADELYLFPEGLVEFTGLSSQTPFIKGFLQKMDIEAQIIRHGKFKSAIEPLTLDQMSEANKLQTTKYVSDLWNHMLEGVASSRKLSVAELQTLADNLTVRNAQTSLSAKLVDKLIYKDELIDLLKKKLGVEGDDKISTVSLAEYNGVKDPMKVESNDKIAVIYAVGGIESGKGDDETIGSETTSKMIREAREDDEVKAIVLRVNSGGGSALASDVIWREMKLAKKVKPVVVSMGDVAASGGYYIACESNAIFASKNTITGSIGVFGVIPNLKAFFNNKLGVTFDGVKTGKNADIQSLVKPLTEEQRQIIQEGVVEIYTDFITKVAEGRSMKVAEVDSIGEGRVWSGMDAKRIGLIDEFGGLTDAIAKAAQLAKLEKFEALEFPKEKDPIEYFMEEFTGAEPETRLLKAHLGEHYNLAKQLKSITELKGVQARMPFEIIVE